MGAGPRQCSRTQSGTARRTRTSNPGDNTLPGVVCTPQRTKRRRMALHLRKNLRRTAAQTSWSRPASRRGTTGPASCTGRVPPSWDTQNSRDTGRRRSTPTPRDSSFPGCSRTPRGTMHPCTQTRPLTCQSTPRRTASPLETRSQVDTSSQLRAPGQCSSSQTRAALPPSARTPPTPLARDSHRNLRHAATPPCARTHMHTKIHARARSKTDQRAARRHGAATALPLQQQRTCSTSDCRRGAAATEEAERTQAGAARRGHARVGAPRPRSAGSRGRIR